jgi:predicted anti-sigma-YlaC factor YlaD
MTVAVSERSCARARRALSLTLDGEASPDEVYRLASHLGNCESCRRFTAQVGALTRALRSIRLELISHHETTPSKGATS